MWTIEDEILYREYNGIEYKPPRELTEEEWEELIAQIF